MPQRATLFLLYYFWTVDSIRRCLTICHNVRHCFYCAKSALLTVIRRWWRYATTNDILCFFNKFTVSTPYAVALWYDSKRDILAETYAYDSAARSLPSLIPHGLHFPCWKTLFHISTNFQTLFHMVHSFSSLFTNGLHLACKRSDSTCSPVCKPYST